MRIDLPNGQWAELRDPEAVTERQRRPIARALRGVRPEIQERSRAAADLPDLPDGKPGPEKQEALQRLQFLMTNEEADAYQDAGDFAAVALIGSWSFEPVPSLDGLLDLPARSLDMLRRAVAPLVNDLFLDTGPDPNRAAPSGGSNGSATPSTEVQPTTSPTSGATSDSSD